MPAARALAEFVTSTTLADVPLEVQQAVGTHVVDQLGIQVACSTLPTTASVREYALRFGAAGPATLIGTGEQVDAELAALVNGTSGHGFEMDDYTTGTMAHPGCVTVPAAFATGEEVGATGSDVLLATCLGFEVVIRIARATMPSMLVERAFHQSAVHGVFAAAATTASLTGQDAATAEMALCLAASHASGIAEYDQTGGSVKRLHAGMGAAGGIRSARLAALGVTGPPTALEGARGFLHAFVPDPHPEFLTAELGTRWLLLDHLSLKPYCCAASAHCGIDALQELLAEQRIEWRDIDQIRMGASHHFLIHVGQAGPEPRDLTQAQFSAHFALALAAVKGANDFPTYIDAWQQDFREADVLEVARRVRLEYDQEIEDGLPDYLGKVEVTTKSGSTYETRAYAKGSKRRPMTEQDVAAKFAANLSVITDAAGAAEAAATIRDLARLPDLRPVLDRLVAPVPAH